MTKDACVSILKDIYEEGVDVVYAFQQGVEPITLLASRDGCWMQAAYEPKQYDDVESVYEALVAVEQLHEEDPVWSLLQNLRQLT